jgi:tetratricopeptide (TPR) repeat protein
LPAGERLDGAERLLDLRQRLLAGQPDDPRRALWLADQATDLLLVLLPIDASGLTSLFGLPSQDQRARAQRVARQMSALAAEADLEIERTILSLESAPGYVDDLAAQLKRRRLAEGERERRIPFLRGVGACLEAALDEQAPAHQEALYRLAVERLRPLVPMLAGRSADLARLYAGLALRGLGEYEAAQAALEPPAPAPPAEPADLFAIRMGQVTITAARDGPEAGLNALDGLQQHYDRADDLFFRVLMADQRFLLHQDAARLADGPQRSGHLARAFGAYLDLLEGRPGPTAQGVRAVVLDRLARAVDAETPFDELPGIVCVAWAERLAGQADTRPQAIALFGQLLERGDLDTAARVEALWGSARALLADEQLVASAERYGQLAREHPTARHAERAIELAATIAAELYRRAPDDPATRSRLRSTVDLLLDRYPNLPSAERWRFAAASLALDEGRHEQAVALLEQVPPNAAQWLDAQLRRAGAVRSWAKAEADPDAVPGRWQQLLAATDAVEPAVRRALAAAGEAETVRLRDDLAVLRVYRAEAQLALGDAPTALETLKGVGDDSSLASDAVLCRIEAHGALGAHAEIERDLERLMAVAGSRAGAILAAMLDARRTVPDAQRELVPVARALERWLRTAGDDARDRTRLVLAAADAYRRAEYWDEALNLYDRLLARHPHALEALLGRAECLFGLGDAHLADAMQLYKRISGATGGGGGDDYWQAQLRMLQILSRTGRNTQRIAPHIQRLRRKDPELGGVRFRREFERLQAEHS